MKYRKRTVQWLCLTVTLCLTALLFSGCSSRAKETEELAHGIDVSSYQGTIDWEAVAASGVDFVMVRLGYRNMTTGEIFADTNARYNMQEASKQGIKLGAYFFSTAVSETEAREEAKWVAEMVSQYSITYPIAYDCENYLEPESRQYDLTKQERTDIALAFLKAIEKEGYEAMFYASKNQIQDENHWETSRIEKDFKIWVAQYPEEPYPGTPASSYSGVHHMWQYTMSGTVDGITQPVDQNVAYFGYEGINAPVSDEAPETVGPDPEALMDFTPVQEPVTAKIEAALRDIPSQGEDSTVLLYLQNGEEALRTGIDELRGWSRVEYNGQRYYVVSSRITTDLAYQAVPEYEPKPDDGLKTQFIAVNEQVTAKEYVNLRTLPSTEHEDCEIAAVLYNGEVVTRTGIDDKWGWSRVEYKGQVLYCVSSMLKVVD